MISSRSVLATGAAVMLRGIKESDWKVFRRLREVALERFCERALAEMRYVAGELEKTSHERYLAVWKVMNDRDDELAAAFNNPRRSAALEQLMLMRSHKLLTDEEMAQFSDESRGVMKMLLGESCAES
jgi:hypothetical protein